MKFNKSLDWLKESNEDDNLLADDELDAVEEEMNEGLYVDPSNYDKHNDLVDVIDNAGNPQKMTQATYDKNKDSGEFEKKEPEKDKQPEKTKDDKELQQYLNQDYGKFDDIPNRNNVDWKTVSDNAKSDYERLTIQLFNKKKAHDSFAYSVVKSALDNNLDGAVIDWIKGHMQETPEITQALKEFDDALQEKDLSKSWKAYQNLWDAHRNATKRKRSK